MTRWRKNSFRNNDFIQEFLFDPDEGFPKKTNSVPTAAPLSAGVFPQQLGSSLAWAELQLRGGLQVPAGLL